MTNNKQFITTKPDFMTVHELVNETNTLIHMLTSVIDDDDTVQRVTDLYGQIEMLHSQIVNMIIEDK